MEFSDMPEIEYCVSIPEELNQHLHDHLIREDGDEDLIFALWYPSVGTKRTTGLINEIIFPKEGDRQRHGNVSYNPKYFKRVCEEAMKKRMGICFIHSHPFPGWQGMSSDDVAADTRMAPTAFTFSDLPLIGMTVGSDGVWSARIWNHLGDGVFKMHWMSLVKSVGLKLSVSFNDKLMPLPEYQEMFKRTSTVYGRDNHEKLCRLKIGIVGLGSVGSIVAENLARMGIQQIVLIDFDKIKRHNLDRQLGATKADLGKLKIQVVARQIRQAGTAASMVVHEVPYGINEKQGYEAALSCDVLFSCVDRPWPRHILNHIAYAHLIPVIDGGISVSFDNGVFVRADWQFQTVSPKRPCLQCLSVYESSDVALDKSGMLDKQSYLDGLPDHHPLKNNENIFPFSAHLASFEVFHLMALVTRVGGIQNFGVQRYRYIPGFLSSYTSKDCSAGCTFKALVATGDKVLSGLG
jgi:molybdopterin/thiamine biosynthesis adenylyltransferase